MSQNRYFDWSRGVMLDSEKDGCRYEEWSEKSKTYPFSVHPNGFLVFLSPELLRSADEYRDDDPYTMEDNIEGAHHQRRIECTLELIDSVLSQDKADIRIMDLGCGRGIITSLIHERFPRAEISGIDHSISAVNYAVEHFEGIDFVVGNACDPPYAAEYFDIVVCNNVWEHIPNPLSLLEKTHRIVKKNGYLIVSTPSRYRIANLVRAVQGKPLTLMARSHVTEYSVGQITEQLEFGGFKICKVYSKPVKHECRSIKERIVYQYSP